MTRADWGEMLGVLENQYRRRLLVGLLDHNPQRDSVDIPEDVHVGDKELEVLNAGMYHTHLPKLEEAGFIRWDRDRHEVHKGPNFDEIRPLLELIENHRDELPDGWV
jgi:predicted transcriptional regulator